MRPGRRRSVREARGGSCGEPGVRCPAIEGADAVDDRVGAAADVRLARERRDPRAPAADRDQWFVDAQRVAARRASQQIFHPAPISGRSRIPSSVVSPEHDPDELLDRSRWGRRTLAARVAAPGGRVALFELIAGPGGPVEFPVPWADGPGQSWIVPADEVRALLTEAGLTIREWREDQDALAAIGAAAQAEPARPAPESLGLHLLMPEHDARMAGLARNVEGRRIVLVQILAERPPLG